MTQKMNMHYQCFDQLKQFTLDYECMSEFTRIIIITVLFLLTFTIKMPQIITIIKTKSVKGLSAFSYYSDFISGIFQGLYCFHIGLTPSIYAEFIVLAIQNVIIIILAWYYTDSNKKNCKDEKVYISNYVKRYLFVILITLFIYLCLLNEGKYINYFIWDLMATSNIPFVTISRLTQIISIIRTKEVESVSQVSYLMRFIKNALKSITIVFETTNYILLVNNIYAGVLSLVVVFLISFYKQRNYEIVKNKFN